MKTEPVPPEDIERWKLEMAMIKMEAGDHLPGDTAITPVTDPADRLYFLLDDGVSVWLGADGSAVTDRRLADGSHHVRIYRAGEVVATCDTAPPRA